MGSVFMTTILKVANVLQCAGCPHPMFYLFISPSAAIFIREFREQSKMIFTSLAN